ncbi:BTAD domain-containing putative transcriptional regulator [Streptomyces sp. URMC 124]|uniref:AfsR/SARP family transcriptional regulator n=1 Tax=Streptomyces sp. URMC 124 TaxID=3423405 RepID=UPI003F1E0362
MSAAKQRALLAMLLLRGDEIVTAEELIDGLWGLRPPKTARTTLHNYIRRLRQVLRVGSGDDTPLETVPQGYVLNLAANTLDVSEFERLIRQAGDARARSDLHGVSRILRAGLSLWRGAALEGVASSFLTDVEAPRLEEARLSTFERLVEAELTLGRHVELVAEIRQYVDRNPLREALRAQYMVALYRSGRRADALEAYREGRRILIEELGLEPGEKLRAIESAILADDHSRMLPDDPAPGADHVQLTHKTHPAPMQLPADTVHFTGRLDHLQSLESWAVGSRTTGPLIITTIDGQGGVGKTSLAVHWAHTARERFPDGQLYIDLRGFSKSEPLAAIDALRTFIHALGVPHEQIPQNLDGATGLYRSLLANKRVLILLDNARSAEQVRPLLPSSSGTFAVVTSRDSLVGLIVRDGGRRIRLDVLNKQEARLLLERVLGKERVQAEYQAADQLAGLCGYLPLALRIAAVNLLELHENGRIADYVCRLLQEDQRLGTLAVSGDDASNLRAVFHLTYASLTPDEQFLFRVLGLLPGPVVTLGAAAALAGLQPGRTLTMLNRLAGVHLIDQRDSGTFAFHDLLRLFAAECATLEEGSQARGDSIARLFRHYLASADLAARLLYPEKVRLPNIDVTSNHCAEFSDQGEAYEWIQKEHVNIVAALKVAEDLGFPQYAWQLCDTLRGYFWLCRDGSNWLSISNAAVAAARRAGDDFALSAAQISLGDAHRSLGQYEEAARHYESAFCVTEIAGWQEGKALALNDLGLVDILTGRLQDAVKRYTAAQGSLPDDPRYAILKVSITANLGILHHELGRLRQSEEFSLQALELSRKISLRGSEGMILSNLGEARYLLGNLEGAMADLTDALAIHREIGNRGSEAEALRAISEIHRDRGQWPDALRFVRAALVLADETDESRLESAVLETLASIYMAMGDARSAEMHFSKSQEIACRIGARHTETMALIGISGTRLLQRDFQGAEEEAEKATKQACAWGYRVLEGRALTALARIRLGKRQLSDALQLANQAALIQVDTGHRFGEAQAVAILRAAHEADGNRAKADSQQRKLGTMVHSMGLDVRQFMVQ